MKATTRKYTSLLLELVDENMLNKDRVIKTCINYMSEKDVQYMMEFNNWVEESEDSCSHYSTLVKKLG